MRLASRLSNCGGFEMPKGVYSRMITAPAERVLRRSVLDPATGCVLFCGCKNSKGYGQIRTRGRGQLAHRATYEAAFGKIPKGMHVLHRCDVPLCVNPDHLFLGTQADNVADMHAKGRAPIGETHASSKITQTIADQIRSSAERGRALAATFGVSEALISGIRTGKLWAR